MELYRGGWYRWRSFSSARHLSGGSKFICPDMGPPQGLGEPIAGMSRITPRCAAIPIDRSIHKDEIGIVM